MSNLCKLFGRTTTFNILIYISFFALVFTCGYIFIYGITREDEKEKKKWFKTGYIVTIISIIFICLLVTCNWIFFELSFSKKCEKLDQFIQEQIENLKTKVTVDNISRKTSEIISDTLASELKKQLKDKILNPLKSGS